MTSSSTSTETASSASNVIDIVIHKNDDGNASIGSSDGDDDRDNRNYQTPKKLNVRKRRKRNFVLLIKSGKKNMIGLPIAPGTRQKQNVKYVLKRLLWRMTVLMLLNLTSDLKCMGSVCRQLHRHKECTLSSVQLERHSQMKLLLPN
jgi:hypothetical protein